MRLHTNFRDYYDTAVGFGVDEKVHYERTTKQGNIRIPARTDWPRESNAGLIGFCGQVFPFIKLNKYEGWTQDGCVRSNKIIESYYAYTFDEYVEKRKEWLHFLLYDTHFDESRKRKLRQFFIDWSFQSNEIFLEFKVPIWVFRFHSGSETNGILNPRLKDYDFDRIKDSVTAFQEISMYLSNILIEQKEIATVEDRYRVTRHGFDLKTSFRRPKGNEKK